MLKVENLKKKFIRVSKNHEKEEVYTDLPLLLSTGSLLFSIFLYNYRNCPLDHYKTI